ncbi:MAG: lysophospholipase [Candidatus Eiseniibacteriota bacterium]
MNPAAGGVPSTPLELRISSRTTLVGRAWCAESPRALVGLVHGLGEHSGRYAALAEQLVRARFTAVALDLPGHGETPGARGDIPSWSQMIDAVIPALFTASRGLPGQPMELPHLLLGHSMGGLIALDFALAHPRSLLAVVATGPALKSWPPPRWKLALAALARAVAPGAGFPSGLDESGISSDPEVLAARASDPLVHDRISPRAYFALAAAQRRVMAKAPRLQVPALIVQGAADRVIDPHGALEFTGFAPHAMARLVTVKDAYHEVLNEPSRLATIRDIIAWLDAVLVV